MEDLGCRLMKDEKRRKLNYFGMDITFVQEIRPSWGEKRERVEG